MSVLALGWYGHSNVGDEAFRPAIEEILGVEVDFADYLPADLSPYQALVIGGGSFLDQEAPGTFATPPELPIGFLGVGIHGVVHASWKPLLDRAEIIVSRNRCAETSFHAPDLIFARTPPNPTRLRRWKHMLILPNGYACTENYKTQIRQVMQNYLDQGWSIELQPMLTDGSENDDRVAIGAIAHGLEHDVLVGRWPLNEAQLIGKMDAADIIVSSRFHGCAFATWLGDRFVGISSHDKFRSFFDEAGWRNCVDAWTFSGSDLDEAMEFAPRLDHMMRYSEKGAERWHELSATVRARLSL